MMMALLDVPVSSSINRLSVLRATLLCPGPSHRAHTLRDISAVIDAPWLNHTLSRAWSPRGGNQRRGQSEAEAGRTVLRLSGRRVESEKIPEWTIRNK